MARKKAEHEGEENAERWLLTYADMITLLLALFIVLYSFANLDLQKFASVAESISRAFGYGSGGGLLNSLSGSVHSVTKPFLFTELPQQQQDFLSVGADMAQFADQAGLAGDIAVNMTYEGVVISLSDVLTFEAGGAELTPQAKTALDAVAVVLKDLTNSLRVEAHTDDLPTENPLYPTNWELSVARSVAIVRYLAETCGVDPARLSAAGDGEFKPLVPNNSREHRAINRRAEIIILYPVDEQQFDLAPLMNPALAATPDSAND
ncbi:MAG: OmpA/MotB family protein [Anaerolineae bacterium]